MGPAPEPQGLDSQDHTTDPACAEKWEICMDQAAAIRLAAYIGQAQRWIRDATTQCTKDPPEQGENNAND